MLADIIAWVLKIVYGAKFIRNYNRANVYLVQRIIPKWAAAQTWGEHIFVRVGKQNERALLKHEFVHVTQWRKYGWTFIPRYIWATIIAIKKHGWGNGYTMNAFEKEARGEK